MQRVAIGRALVREPAVTLMDEPLSSLDAKLRNDLRLELKRIQQDLGATMLYVTHDQTEALTLATRIGVLDHGRLAQVGSPRQIYEDPQTSAVAARLGSPRINLRRARRARRLAGADAAPSRSACAPSTCTSTPRRRRRRPRAARDRAADRAPERPAPGAPRARRQRRRADQRRAGARLGRARQRGARRARRARSGSTPPAAASPREPAHPCTPRSPPHGPPVADPRRHADADRSRRRADRARPAPSATATTA